MAGVAVVLPVGVMVAGMKGLVVVGTGVILLLTGVAFGVVLFQGLLEVLFLGGTLCPQPARRIMAIRRRAMRTAGRMIFINGYLINQIFMPLSHGISAAGLIEGFSNRITNMIWIPTLPP
jgi:hypothetical protein